MTQFNVRYLKKFYLLIVLIGIFFESHVFLAHNFFVRCIFYWTFSFILVFSIVYCMFNIVYWKWNFPQCLNFCWRDSIRCGINFKSKNLSNIDSQRELFVEKVFKNMYTSSSKKTLIDFKTSIYMDNCYSFIKKKKITFERIFKSWGKETHNFVCFHV